jgi:hypothetical protein
MMAVFVEKLTPFLEEFLNKIEMLNYPKSSMHLLIHNKVGGIFYFFSGDKSEHFFRFTGRIPQRTN